MNFALQHGYSPERLAAASDTSLCDELQRSAFRYFQDYGQGALGLVADASSKGTPSSIAATGFGLACLPVAAERGWMPREDAYKAALTTLRFFAGSPQSRAPVATGYRGFYYHFLDMENGQRAWRSELSLIDTALLLAGALVASAYFTRGDEGELRDLADMLYARANWSWATAEDGALTLGWKPRTGFLPYRWEGYSEALILYVLALASRSYPAPPQSYHHFARRCDWHDVNGQPFLYAGPLFIHLFSHAFIDFRGICDGMASEHGTDYFINTQTAVAVQRDYAIRNPHGFKGYGADCWGLTACDGPQRSRRLFDGRRHEFSGYLARGAPFGPDDGTLAPWAPLACLPFAPDAAIAGTRHLLETYPNVLKNGQFVGSFNPSVPGPTSEGWLDDRVIGLDQGLLVLMLENHRSGMIWELMRGIPLIRRGLSAAGFAGGWLETPSLSGGLFSPGF
ncbi:hypothetical protein BJF93_20935 [Xaviernesmea oryzae]|uniref:Glycoamylase-like domain-containing protein n=1 Tax=Xaviernesmea oryzae TaxID=464029 RepID=A0A1Q9AZV1_9HYPH|nr:glucoamylase family protein [Xaviernesmea oryzae]OLP61253.1 hypothetical protein BJF93_20935 [Xaviernesmea oryzae]SEL52176.1 hypothetical protein SAMN04487976_10965 [Xaviernesmea oryzae]